MTTHTHTTAYLFDQVLVGKVEDALDELRQDWEARSEYIGPQALEAGEARLSICEGLPQILRDAV